MLTLLGLLLLFVYVKVRFDALEAATDRAPGSAGLATYVPPELKPVEVPSGVTFRGVYVPVDTHAYHAGGQALLLEPTLVLRNPSSTDPVYVERVDYFASGGERLRSFTSHVFELGPLQRLDFSGKREAKTEPEGSHFVVRWGAGNPQLRPIVEAIMVDERGQVVLLRDAVPLRTSAPPTRDLPRRGAAAASDRPGEPRAAPPAAPSPELKRPPFSSELREKNP